MNIFKKKNLPQLSRDDAAAILSNVFTACDAEPNSTSFEKLASYSEYRAERYSLQKRILLVVFAVFCLLPFFFISPVFTIEKLSSSDADRLTYEIKLADSIIPVSTVTANVDGRSIPVYETGNRTYSVSPTFNGQLSIFVQLYNKQYNYSSELTCGDILIDSFDETPPQLDPERHYTRSEDGSMLLLYFVEEGSGLDYESSYCEAADGSVSGCIESMSDPAENLMAFNFPSGASTFFIYDLNGNVLKLSYS